jgi:signal transduction histidine kinase
MNTTGDIKEICEKIDNLNAEAWAIRVQDSAKAMELSKQAVALASDIDYTKGLAQGLRTLGFSYVRISQHEEALKHLDRADELFKSLNDRHGQADVMAYYGLVERGRGNLGASLDLFLKALEMTQSIGYKEAESLFLYHVGVCYRYLGNFEQALNYFLKGLDFARSINDWTGESYSLNNIGLVYLEIGDYANALQYYHQSLDQRRKFGDKWGESGCLDNIGFVHYKLGNFREAIDYCSQGLAIAEQVGDQKGRGNTLLHLANVYQKLRQPDKALDSYSLSLDIRRKIGDKKGEAEILLFLAELKINPEVPHQEDSQVFDLLATALELAEQTTALDLLAKIHSGYYKAHKACKAFENALAHLEIFLSIEKQIHKETIDQKIVSLEISNRVEQTKKEAEIFRLRNVELEGALQELKSTQAQLIQAEKMASLGELTAGIAHEIQNPLNFVNNFAEVNKELVEEMKEEIRRGNQDLAAAVAENIAANEEKIAHHGRRADAIVKAMLQHSRTSTGRKEPVDINALADEYLRLSYHGLRAKDKSFNATIETDVDPAVGMVSVAPQDMGRVLLNLFNNALYSVTEKKRREGKGYEPVVRLVTKRMGDKVEITIRDNGQGIPQKLMDKIFQPFFTTKPAGQGTGLGLSLSYDIVTKEHNGQVRVDSREGEYAEFIIELPVN